MTNTSNARAASKQQHEQQQTATPDITTNKETQNTRGACANYVKLCEMPAFLAFCAIATCAFFNC